MPEGRSLQGTRIGVIYQHETKSQAAQAFARGVVRTPCQRALLAKVLVSFLLCIPVCIEKEPSILNGRMVGQTGCASHHPGRRQLEKMGNCWPEPQQAGLRCEFFCGLSLCSFDGKHGIDAVAGLSCQARLLVWHMFCTCACGFAVTWLFIPSWRRCSFWRF